MKFLSVSLSLLFFGYLGGASAFVPPSIAKTPPSSTSSLNLLLDVPDGFFTVTFLGSGLILSFAKNFGRMRMEERAWEQRLEEGRKRRLREDPTLSELDLRRREAELEWSAYGKPETERELLSQKPRKRVKVMEREAVSEDGRENRMTDQEIDAFETEFGIDYDPYYDDPYSLEELPEGNFQTDKRYGDRFYEDGEMFYKDAETGLYYRQGARPRSINFFSP